jgi:hypothetical protein
MPGDVLPGDGLPGHHQGLALCFGAWPLTHRFTLQHTGPTSASPGRSSWPGLLRASFSPTACGWPLLGEMTRLTEGWWGLLRSQYSWFVSIGRCSPPGLFGSACRSVDAAAGALSCAVLAPATQPLTLGEDHDGSSHLRWRCPSIPARRDTRREAARVRRLSPLQAVEDQSRAWGICCHSCPEREGLAPS